MLERAGLIARDRDAQYRPSTLRVEPLKEATAWMAPYRELWEGRMDRLGAHLENLEKGQDNDHESTTRSTSSAPSTRRASRCSQAWTDPEQVAAWWGPEHFESRATSVAIDLRAGGRYDLMMVRPRSGEEFPVRQEVLEVSAPELLVLRHEPMPEHGLLEAIVTRIEFHEHDGGTRVDITGGPYPAEMGPNAEHGLGAAARQAGAPAQRLIRLRLLALAPGVDDEVVGGVAQADRRHLVELRPEQVRLARVGVPAPWRRRSPGAAPAR